MGSYIIGIIGDRGDGKTCLTTHLLYEAFINGNDIFSNYKLTFIDDDHYISFEEMSKLPNYLKDGYVGMDEIQMAMDSRNFLSDGNKKLTKLVTQIRKRGLTLIYTTQRLGMADLRLRQQTDYLFFPEKQKPFTKDGVLIDSLFKVTVQEVKSGRVLKPFYYDAHKYYDMYDTSEIIEFDKKEA